MMIWTRAADVATDGGTGAEISSNARCCVITTGLLVSVPGITRNKAVQGAARVPAVAVTLDTIGNPRDSA